MKYDVVQSNVLSYLIEQVKKLIEEGWEPQGGISTTSVLLQNKIHYSYFQAMIKRD